MFIAAIKFVPGSLVKTDEVKHVAMKKKLFHLTNVILSYTTGLFDTLGLSKLYKLFPKE